MNALTPAVPSLPRLSPLQLGTYDRRRAAALGVYLDVCVPARVRDSYLLQLRARTKNVLGPKVIALPPSASQVMGGASYAPLLEDVEIEKRSDYKRIIIPLRVPVRLGRAVALVERSGRTQYGTSVITALVAADLEDFTAGLDGPGKALRSITVRQGGPLPHVKGGWKFERTFVDPASSHRYAVLHQQW